MKPDAFRDQVVIIIGASAGISKVPVLQLAGRGAKPAIAAQCAKYLEQGAAEYRLSGGEALNIPAGVSDETQCQTLVKKTVAISGRLDMLINNARRAGGQGISYTGHPSCVSRPGEGKNRIYRRG